MLFLKYIILHRFSKNPYILHRLDKANLVREGEKMSMPLSAVKEGSEVRVIGFRGGVGLIQKLTAMGFVTGSRLKVIRSQVGGPMIVLIKGSQMAIGRGIASKIEVE